MKLYEIPQEIESFEQRLIDSGGELTPELEAEWSAFVNQGKDKLEAAAFVISGLEDDIETCEAEISRLRKRAASGQNNAKRLKDLTLYALKAMGGKLKTALVSLWVGRTGQQISIELKEGTDLMQLQESHPQFVRIRREVNLEALKNAVKAGESVPDCFHVRHIEPTEYLRIQ